MFKVFQGPQDWVAREAPELKAKGPWHHSGELTLKSLRGKGVLLDFMTYSCINCIRTFPYLNAWYEKYRERGLEIIGIHCPEFAFEKEESNVAAALERFDIRFPVVQDNEFRVWKDYANQWWPRKLLIDQQGVVRYDHIGEGNYRETEQQIQKVLGIEEGLSAGQDPLMMAHTKEIYCGYQRGSIGNMDGLKPEHLHHYKEEGVRIRGLAYVKGKWKSHPEFLHHAEQTPGEGDYLYIKFLGKSANMVLGQGERKPYRVRVEMDGKPLEESNRGRDVQLQHGESGVEVNQFRMYELVRDAEYGEHELKLISDSDGFAVYSCTFGG